MKTSRYIKLRTFVSDPEDIALERNHNPLRRKVPTGSLPFIAKDNFLDQAKFPADLERAAIEPCVHKSTIVVVN